VYSLKQLKQQRRASSPVQGLEGGGGSGGEKEEGRRESAAGKQKMPSMMALLGEVYT
jgi:hypothetical protein